MTPAQLRREILGALHAITGSFEPWRELGEAIVAYLGPSVGMGLTERWERMGVLEMEELADALEERAAIMTLQSDHDRRRAAIVCGGRDYEPKAGDRSWLVWWLRGLAVRRVIHGGARGVDMWAGAVGAQLGLEVDSYPADWETHGKAAGPIRNRLMLEAGPSAVLVFPGGRGTADMAIAAANAGVTVIERSNPRTAVIKSATKGMYG